MFPQDRGKAWPGSRCFQQGLLQKVSQKQQLSKVGSPCWRNLMTWQVGRESKSFMGSQILSSCWKSTYGPVLRRRQNERVYFRSTL